MIRNILLIFCLASLAQGQTGDTANPARAGNTTDDLNSNTMKKYLTIVNPDAIAQVIIPGTTGPTAVSSSIIQAPAQEMSYLHKGSNNPPIAPLMLIRDPKGGKITINFKSDFYVTGIDGLTGCSVFFDEVGILRPLMVIPGTSGNFSQAITQFAATWSEEKLIQQFYAASEPPFPGRVRLREAANQGFFQGNSDPRSAQLAAATLKSYSVTDGVLHLELSSPKNVYRGDFWIDLKTEKVIKSMIDGQPMDLTTGAPYAVPVK